MAVCLIGGIPVSGDADSITHDRVELFIEELQPSSFGPGVTGTDTGLLPPGFDPSAATGGPSPEETVDAVQQLLNPIGLLFNNSGADIDQFLAATQAAFVNGLEVVLIEAFSLAPIVVALLLTSRGGQALFAWFSGIAGLYATQLIYNVIVGVISLFIFTRQGMEVMNASGEVVTTTLAGLDRRTFEIFIAVLAPLISLNLGYGQFARVLSGSFATARFLRDPESGRDESLGRTPLVR